MLVARNLSLAFGARTILDAFSLSLVAGERVALVGQNGVGKSTLLKILARHMAPDSGEVAIAQGRRVGVLAQEPALNDADTVLQAVRKGLAEHEALVRQHQVLCEELSHSVDASRAERLHKQ